MLSFLIKQDDPAVENLLHHLCNSQYPPQLEKKIHLLQRTVKWLELASPAFFPYATYLASVDMNVLDISVFPQSISGMSAQQFRGWMACQEAVAMSELNSCQHYSSNPSQETNSDKSQILSKTPAAIAGVTRSDE